MSSETALSDEASHSPLGKTALFAIGFRPFFLAAGTISILFMALWTVTYEGSTPISYYYGHTLWHSHEMVFGFTLAVIGGFLLTAVQNWTGIPTLKGRFLACLLLLWVSGRILPLLNLPVSA